MQRRTWLKVGLAALFVVVVAWLFLRTVRSTIAEPYSVDAAALSGWTLVIQETRQPVPALIALVPPSGLVPALFQQIFSRTMESITTPTQPAMSIVLQSEFVALQEVLSAAEILDAARTAGLEEARFEPVCMAVKRRPSSGRTLQFHFVVFEAPAFTRFRAELARRYQQGGGRGTVRPGRPGARDAGRVVRRRFRLVVAVRGRQGS